MKLLAVSGAPEARSTDLLAYAVFAAADTKGAKGTAKKPAANKPKTLPPSLHAVDAALSGLLSEVAASEGFTGAAGQTLAVHTHGRIAAARVLLVGLGSADKLGPDTLRRFAGIVVKHAEKAKAKKALIVLPDEEGVRLEPSVQCAAEGALLATYRFDKYLTKDKTTSSVEVLEIALASRSKVDDALARARAVAEGVFLARDLVNEPAGSLTPIEFAKRAVDAGRAAGFKVVVLDEKGIAKERMGMIQAVFERL